MSDVWSGRVPRGWKPPPWLPAWRVIAIVAGLVASLCALVSPLLPLYQKTIDVQWPQHSTLTNVTAPLDSFVAEKLDVSAPCALAQQLPASGGNIVSTAPTRGKNSGVNSLYILADKDSLVASVRAAPLLVIPRSQQNNPRCVIHVFADSSRTVARIDGVGDQPLINDVSDPLLRPQIVGVFTDLRGPAPQGLRVAFTIDTRFNTVATPLRWGTALFGFATAVLSLIALLRFDSLDRRRHRRFLPHRWWKLSIPDVVVVSLLCVWLFIGANTSDDGYQLTWEVVSPDAGYMVSYHRWFGVAENPVTWYYQVCSWLAQLSTAAPVMRLPQCLIGIICWFTLSKEVIPRLGRLARKTPAAIWAAAGVFLSLWLAYANGLRPEPVVALGALLTWCSVERTIATGRLLPAATAVFIASFCLGAAPGGLIAAAALVVGTRQGLRRFAARAKLVGAGWWGWLAVTLPVFAAGTLVVPVVFWNQSLAGIIEGNFHVKTTIGPNRAWYEELLRYYYLMLPTADGSLARRFGVLVAFLCLVTASLILLRHRHLGGLSRGPAIRLVGIFVGTIFCMTFTPTKWTHHFGIYAGIAGAIAAFTTAAIGPAVITRLQGRIYFAAASFFVLAVALTGLNQWWYVSSWGVPWWDRPPVVAGYLLADVVLVVAIVTALLAFWYQLRAQDRNPSRGSTLWMWSLPAVAFAMVAFILLSFVKGAYTQRHSFSWTASNYRFLTSGDGCALANDVWVEEDPTQGILTPIGGVDARSALQGTQPTGFSSQPDHFWKKLTTTFTDYTDISPDEPEPTARPVPAGEVPLPFGLNPDFVPVLGSYGVTVPTSVITHWYALPRATQDRPLITLSAAGRFAGLGLSGVPHGPESEQLLLEYGHLNPEGTVHSLGQSKFYDIGPDLAWRNVRIPRESLPSEADVVRIRVIDQSTDPDQWIAFTPPRVSSLRTLQSVVGDQPALIDWQVFFQFPCQHPIRIREGMFEIPTWRILPDHGGTKMNSEKWMSPRFGGPLGVTQRLLSPSTMATYLRGRPDLDWGSLQRYTPYEPDQTPAQLIIGTARHSGLYSPGPMYTMYGKDDEE